MSRLHSIFAGLLAVVSLVHECGLCQIADALSFLPHHLGDLWEYYDPYHPFTEQIRITKDSLASDGRYWIETTKRETLVLDTAASTVYQVGGFGKPFELFPKFKLDADSGDVWTVFQDSVYRKSARVVDTYDTYLFGPEIVAVKEVDFYDYTLGNPESLLTDTYYLASGYGIIAWDIDTFPVWRLRGCIIGGVLHGTVTSVAHSQVPLAPEGFHLWPNYPNPFNPGTTIRYELPRSSMVNLTVYDLLGREVSVLVNEREDAGVHEVRFDGRGLSSGIYLCRLTAGNFAEIRKFVLLE